MLSNLVLDEARISRSVEVPRDNTGPPSATGAAEGGGSSIFKCPELPSGVPEVDILMGTREGTARVINPRSHHGVAVIPEGRSDTFTNNWAYLWSLLVVDLLRWR